MITEYTSDDNFFRVITDNFPKLPWSSKKTSYGHCHWGQRKLLYSEIEFLLYVAQYQDLSECVVLYVGSAPGTHTNILIEMFPMLKWILYDPREFDIHQEYIDNGIVEIHTGDDGFFTDEHVKTVLSNPICKNKKILFISDIRFAPNEKQIFKENINQQRWLIQLNAYAYVMKLRILYDYKREFKYDISDIQDKLDLSDLKVPDSLIGQFLYLDGIAVTQIYAPIYSGEGRLMGRIGDNGKYKLKYYDYQKYEENMMYFNEVLRNKNYVYKESEQVKHHILGIGDSYDNVAEYYFLRGYLKMMGKKYELKNIIKLMYKINKKMSKFTKRDFVPCVYSSFMKFFRGLEERKRNIKELGNSMSEEDKKRKIQSFKNEQRVIVYSALSSYKNMLSLLKTQRDVYFPEKGILKDIAYEKQIKKADKLINKTNKFIEKIEKLVI